MEVSHIQGGFSQANHIRITFIIDVLLVFIGILTIKLRFNVIRLLHGKILMNENILSSMGAFTLDDIHQYYIIETLSVEFISLLSV